MEANKKVGSGTIIIVKMSKILVFVWGDYFYSGMPIFNCENGYLTARIHVNTGIGLPILYDCVYLGIPTGLFI